MDSILVSRLRFMGDVILTLPAVHVLRTAFPEAKITYLSEKPFSTLLLNHPDLDCVIELDPHNKVERFKQAVKLIKGHYDLALDLFGNPRSAFLTLISGARMRIGGDFHGRKMAYTHRIPHSPTPQNAIQFHLSYLQPLGLSAEFSEPRIHLTEYEMRQASGFLNRLGIGNKTLRIGIHPGATWPAKQWFPERFSRLADLLSMTMDAQILFTEGPGENELVRMIMSGCNAQMFRTGVLPLRQLAAVLASCDLFISNDCGPMHLGPAVGTKTVGIFGPGEPKIWFPYDPGKGHRFVHRETACSRCHQDFCERMECMKTIAVEDVFEAVRLSLNFD